MATIARFEMTARQATTSLSGLITAQDQPFAVGSYNRRAAALLQSRFGAEDIGTVDAMLELAGVYQRQKHYSEATALYDRALVILMHNLGADDPRVTETLDRLAELHLEQGNSGMASAVLEFARSVREGAN